MKPSPTAAEQLADLAAHLAGRRDDILAAWRTALAADPALTTPSALPRAQLHDHIPHILDALEQRLREAGHDGTPSCQKNGVDHGLHRWQQGYHPIEVAREWGHLHLCLLEELDAYEAGHPRLERGVMPAARRLLARLCGLGVSESMGEYFRLQQTEAAASVRDLEQTLLQLRQLEQARAELWRQAAHDLRGNLGAVSNATAALTRPSVSEGMREQLHNLLQRSVTSLRDMLNDVMQLARLQAGHEELTVTRLDAGGLLPELAQTLEPLASQAGLYLKLEGPASYPVEADAVKVQRIAQNLLLNAIKYTRRGGVTVRWGDSRQGDPDRWMLCIQDTGPGLHSPSATPLSHELEAATEMGHEVEDGDGDGRSSSFPYPSLLQAQVPGEGIGLSIVKRLCELLGAGLEMESEAGSGTTVRVLLPRSYPTSPPPAAV